MAERLIFVSCGQQTAEEKRLGTAVKQLIDSTAGYRAYFAEYVQSLDALAQNVFDGLRRCSGLVSFLHESGLVMAATDKEWGYRSSAWVNQEIAILAYRRQFEGIDLPILVFKDKKVRLEGAMTSLILNPIPMDSESVILKQVASWLESATFPSSLSGADDRFVSKWQKLSELSQKVVSALLEEGGSSVKESAIKTCLREKFGMERNQASQAVLKARLEFSNTDLVKLIHNTHSGYEMSVNPAWEWHISREVAKSR